MSRSLSNEIFPGMGVVAHPWFPKDIILVWNEYGWHPLRVREPMLPRLGERESRMGINLVGHDDGQMESPYPSTPLRYTREDGRVRSGNGQLQSMERHELIELVQKLQRRSRTHKKTITQISAKYNEQLRQNANLREDNAQLREERDSYRARLLRIDDAMYAPDTK